MTLNAEMMQNEGRVCRNCKKEIIDEDDELLD
jgi:hypothetical protein